MISLDDAFLDRAGLSELPAHERLSLLQAIYEELQLRVGSSLAETMSNDELEEFEALIDTGNDEGASAWLSHNRPDYPAVVTAAVDQIAAEVAGAADVILRELGDAS